MNYDPHSIARRARAFLQLLHEEHGLPLRLSQVDHELAESGSYRLTFAELEWGARVAWRQSARCIGRLVWESLVVRDLRHLSSLEDVYQACLDHLIFSTNKGRIIPTISVFAPDGPRILNSQLVRYADDPEQAPFVNKLQEWGWRPSGEPFQLLPLVIEWPGQERLIRPLPEAAVLQVPLTHSEIPAFEQLGLRWHALPAMADRVLEIGGQLYPCAPFSGWYMGTEIGSRDLGDEQRYNVLPALAKAMGLDTSSDRTLWRDRALVELNRAVLESFERHGVTIVDHHTASRQFLRHLESEAAKNRPVSADWSWIVPPLSASATGVFHTPMQAFDCSPNFLTRAQAGLPC